jgi:hypothetical protein
MDGLATDVTFVTVDTVLVNRRMSSDIEFRTGHGYTNMVFRPILRLVTLDTVVVRQDTVCA